MTITTFSEAKNYLFSRIQFGMKAGLENITALCAKLDNPQAELKCFHVAGTNGKGSTSYYLSKLLTAHGYKTGLFTSPHLVSVRERIRIDDTPISEEELTRHTKIVADHASDIDITFFETITAIAFNFFKEQSVDYVVLETGLGGRLDSTNICTSVCSIITSIALDHTAILGNTKSAILSEKLGIAKQNVPLLVSLDSDLLIHQAREHAAALNAPFFSLDPRKIVITPESFTFLAPQNIYAQLTLSNPGEHYRHNAALALTALERVLPKVSNEICKETLTTALWAARMQLLSKNGEPTLILDGGHNPAGIRAMLNTLAESAPGKKYTFLIAVLVDKDLSTMARLIEPYANEVIITKSSHEKSRDPASCTDHFLVPTKSFTKIHDALNYCSTASRPVICTGSLYFMGDLIHLLQWEYPELKWFRQFTPDSNEVR